MDLVYLHELDGEVYEARDIEERQILWGDMSNAIIKDSLGTTWNQDLQNFNGEQ